VFQGSLMLIALVAAPILVIDNVGGVSAAVTKIEGINPELLNMMTGATGEPLGWLTILGLLGWGLGYFGQPHILARFKAIRSADETGVAAIIGVSWASFGYLMAILVGFCGIAYLNEPLADPEKVFITLTSLVFHPLVAGILLAAILAAIMSTVDSQLLVCSAALAEDLYPLMVKKSLSAEARMKIGRIAVVVLAIIASGLAMDPESKVLDVVSYAWAGLGASLGPAILISLYWRSMTSQGALAGILVGAVTVILWSQLSGGIFDIYELVPGFILSSIAVVLVSLRSPAVSDAVGIQFDDMRTKLRGGA
jgi:sodium/proline symporter